MDKSVKKFNKTPKKATPVKVEVSNVNSVVDSNVISIVDSNVNSNNVKKEDSSDVSPKDKSLNNKCDYTIDTKPAFYVDANNACNERIKEEEKEENNVATVKNNIPLCADYRSDSDSDSLDSESDSSSTISSSTTDSISSEGKSDEISESETKQEEKKKKKERRISEFSDLPPIEDLKISVPEDSCCEIGTITSIVDPLVVVESYKGTDALDVGTVLFLENGKRSLGQIFDILGPISEPVYTIRFNNGDQIKELNIAKGMKVYYAPKTEHTSFVFLSEILKNRGSDASWKDNVEAPPEFQDYSDDEEEKLKKKVSGIPYDGGSADSAYSHPSAGNRKRTFNTTNPNYPNPAQINQIRNQYYNTNFIPQQAVRFNFRAPRLNVPMAFRPPHTVPTPPTVPPVPAVSSVSTVPTVPPVAAGLTLRPQQILRPPQPTLPTRPPQPALPSLPPQPTLPSLPPQPTPPLRPPQPIQPTILARPPQPVQPTILARPPQPAQPTILTRPPQPVQPAVPTRLPQPAPPVPPANAYRLPTPPQAYHPRLAYNYSRYPNGNYVQPMPGPPGYLPAQAPYNPRFPGPPFPAFRGPYPNQNLYFQQRAPPPNVVAQWRTMFARPPPPPPPQPPPTTNPSNSSTPTNFPISSNPSIPSNPPIPSNPS